MKSKHEILLDEYLHNIKSNNFYDAHESLEKIWFPRRFEDDVEMKFLKGLINASVCFELKKRGRDQASKKAWKNYLKYRVLLSKIKSPHLNKYYAISRHVDMLKI